MIYCYDNFHSRMRGVQAFNDGSDWTDVQYSMWETISREIHLSAALPESSRIEFSENQRMYQQPWRYVQRATYLTWRNALFFFISAHEISNCVKIFASSSKKKNLWLLIRKKKFFLKSLRIFLYVWEFHLFPDENSLKFQNFISCIIALLLNIRCNDSFTSALNLFSIDALNTFNHIGFVYSK